ncbi:MAG: helix-turn-helix domain-containing protein [Planctomycetota bacterium]
MTLVQSILSLHAERWSQRRIAAALGIDRATVGRHLRRDASSLPPDADGVSNAADQPSAGARPIDPGRVPSAPNAAIAPTGSAEANRSGGNPRNPETRATNPFSLVTI